MPIPQSDIARFLRDHDDFLVASHVSPDGDALGATAAMGHILAHLGKTFTLYNPSGMPSHYDWMPMPGGLRDALPENGFRWAIVLDCGALHRAGEALAEKIDPARTVNIDHHLGNPQFGVLNWVDKTYSSTGEMIAELAETLNVPLRGDLAEALYAAMVTDTGYFSYSYTRPESLELAAKLMREGLDVGAVNVKIRNQWSQSRIRLWSEVLGGLTFHEEGRIGAIAIPHALLEKTGALVEDCDGLVNFALRVKGMQVAVSARETRQGQVKFSLRSTGDVNVQEIAASFGGGGHKNASGGSLEAGISESLNILIQAASKALEPAPHA